MVKDHLYSANKYVDSTQLTLNSEYKRAVLFKIIAQIVVAIISIIIAIVALIILSQNNVKIGNKTYPIQQSVDSVNVKDVVAYSNSKAQVWDRLLFLTDLKKAKKATVKALPLGLVEKDKKILKTDKDEFILETPEGDLLTIKKENIYGSIKE